MNILTLDLDLYKIRKKAGEMTMQNWKTTLAGLVGTLAMAWANYTGPQTWQGYVAALAPVAIGLLAKDFNISLSPAEIGAVTKAITPAIDPKINEKTA